VSFFLAIWQWLAGRSARCVWRILVDEDSKVCSREHMKEAILANPAYAFGQQRRRLAAFGQGAGG
jgi:hypothetical protein